MYEKDLFATGVGVLKKLSDFSVEQLTKSTDYETYFNEILVSRYVETSVSLGGRPTMAGIKRVKEMGIERTDSSKTYSRERVVNVDANGIEQAGTEKRYDGSFATIEGKQEFVCDEPRRFELKSLNVETTYRVKNKVQIPARDIHKTAISRHNVLVVAEGEIVPSSCVGSKTPRSWVIPVQVSRLGFTDFKWDYSNSLISTLNVRYSRAEALANEMFKDSYSTLPMDQKAKVDAAMRGKK
jgi:hypothetical protein